MGRGQLVLFNATVRGILLLLPSLSLSLSYVCSTGILLPTKSWLESGKGWVE